MWSTTGGGHTCPEKSHVPPSIPSVSHACHHLCHAMPHHAWPSYPYIFPMLPHLPSCILVSHHAPTSHSLPTFVLLSSHTCPSMLFYMSCYAPMCPTTPPCGSCAPSCTRHVSHMSLYTFVNAPMCHAWPHTLYPSHPEWPQWSPMCVPLCRHACFLNPAWVSPPCCPKPCCP